MRSFTLQVTRSSIPILSGRLMCALVSMVSICARGQFNVPDIPLCEICPFPVVADVDTNGSPDLIFTSPDLENITWRANDGAGNFGPDQFLAINQRHLTIRLAVDADDDQDIDLIGVTLAPYTDSLVAILRNEDGFYVLDTIDHPMSGPRTLEQREDLDNDGRPDLLSLDNGTADIWYHDDGDGNWTRSSIAHWCLPVGGPYVVLDAEGDGDLDLARYVVEDSRWVVIWNLGGGRFGPWTWATTELAQTTMEPGSGRHDVNDDGLMDLVIGGLASISNGNGTFAPAFGLLLQYEYQSIANVNCGSVAESVLSRSASPTISIRRLDETAAVSDVAAPSLPVRTELHDLDLDGRMDLLMGAIPGPAQLWWRSNDAVVPTVTFTIPDVYDTVTSSTVVPLDLAWGWPLDGGFFSGPGVFNNTFYSGLAGVGDIPITYHYLSFNTQNLCEGTATDTIHVLALTGLAESRHQALVLSPHPADGWTEIRGANGIPSAIRVTDALGRTMPAWWSASGPNADSIRLLTASLPDGAYIVEVTTMKGRSLGGKLFVSHVGR